MAPLERPQERLLLDLLPDLPAGRVLCNTAGRAQFGAAYARQHSHSPVACWLLDLYQRQQCELAVHPQPQNLALVCEADPPAGEVDLVAWAFSRQGESELAREMLQLGHERLMIGGRLVAAIDNPRDQWLHELFRNMFAKVTRRSSDRGVVYLATKTAPLRKLKNYAAEFAFRDGEKPIRLRTRPGVFSHRKLDGGARALIKALTVSPGTRVLDLGCGSGSVALAAALRAGGVQVDAIDSNPRAIESARWAAAGASNDHQLSSSVTATLDCDGSSISSNDYDLVLANPPYFSDYRIPRLFVNTAERALRRNGLLQLVTKTPQWYADHLPDSIHEMITQPVGNYIIVSARKA
jgi:16S rRNA (guanine1207-N2)-methyltransferase